LPIPFIAWYKVWRRVSKPPPLINVDEIVPLQLDTKTLLEEEWFQQLNKATNSPAVNSNLKKIDFYCIKLHADNIIKTIVEGDADNGR
jgi:hypothetical protein